jgi:hypothetical protein
MAKKRRRLNLAYEGHEATTSARDVQLARACAKTEERRNVECTDRLEIGLQLLCSVLEQTGCMPGENSAFRVE